jgi:hypothetical protein
MIDSFRYNSNELHSLWQNKATGHQNQMEFGIKQAYSNTILVSRVIVFNFFENSCCY